MKSQSELKAMYNDEKYVAKYEAKPLSRLRNLFDFMVLSKQFDAVDYACGNGMILEVVKDHVGSYTGVDYSQGLIDAAIKRKDRLKADNARFFCGDIHEFSRQNKAAFDVAFAMDFSEHVLDEDWFKILESIRASLKQGGVLYIHTPNREYVLEIMKAHGVLKQLPGHIAVRSVEHNEDLLRRAGFQIKRTLLIPHYNVMRYFHFLSYIPVVGKYFKARIFIEALNP